LHGLGGGGTLELDESEGQEDLELQFLGKLVVYNSDQSTANLNNFFLDSFDRGEVNDVFEAEGGVSTDHHGSMHDSFLNHTDKQRDSSGNLEHLNVGHLLLVQLANGVALLLLSLRNLVLAALERRLLNLVADHRHKHELAFLRKSTEDRGHAADDLLDDEGVRVVHVRQDTAGVHISKLFVLRFLMLAVSGHKVDVKFGLVLGFAVLIELLDLVLSLADVAERSVSEEVSVSGKDLLEAIRLEDVRLFKLSV